MDQIKFDNRVAQLVTKDRKVLNAVYDSLVYQRPGYQFTKAYKKGTWDGNICLFNRRNWTFPAGLVRWVTEIVNGKGAGVELVDCRSQDKRLPALSDDVIANILEGKTCRDYQVNAIRAAYEKTRGVIQSPTGSGKTVIAAGIVKLGLEHLGLKSLFIVNRKELLRQTRKSFISSGIDCGIVGDGERKIRQVNVATVQTLYAGFEKKNERGQVTRPADPQIQALLKSVDLLILDEAHNGDAISFETVFSTCTNAFYRIGLTATPLMKGIESDIKLMCITGEVIFRITLKDLIDRGLLAQPYIKFVKIATPRIFKDPKGRTLNYQSAYKYGITENERRNELVVKETMELAAAGETVLILVSKINHGKRLQAMFKPFTHLKTRFIHGSKSDEERDSALKELEAGIYNVLISSTITDEGVDIPNISAVVLAGGMKSTIKLYQRIGRAMRPKKGLNRCLVVDFVDLTDKHLAKPSMSRLEAIKSEPGFIVVPDFKTLLRAVA